MPNQSAPARRQSAQAEPSLESEKPRNETSRVTLPTIGLRPAPEIADKPPDAAERLSNAQPVSPPKSKFDLPAMVEVERRSHELPQLPQKVEAPAQTLPRKEAAFSDAAPPTRTSTVEIVRERAEIRSVSTSPSAPRTLAVSEAGEAGTENNALLRKQSALEVPHLPVPEIRPPEQPRPLNAVKSDTMPAEALVRPSTETLNLVAPRESFERDAPFLRPTLQPRLPELPQRESTSEPRVKVHIGTLEIRALESKGNLQAQAPAPSPPLPSPAGFDAFSHLRSYEPWPR